MSGCRSRGGSCETAGLTDGVLTGDKGALGQLDNVVQSDILGESVVRVKVWAQDGTILYSDEPALIGRRFELGEEEQELFETGGADAELSDLSKPENRYERQEGKLLEAHTPIRTPSGKQVLFETYQRFSSINASATRLLGRARPAADRRRDRAAALPGAARLSRSRAACSAASTSASGCSSSAIEASDLERRRIASDLHDGVVQDLAGVAFGLAPLADEAARRGDDRRGPRDLVTRSRVCVRECGTCGHCSSRSTRRAWRRPALSPCSTTC